MIGATPPWTDDCANYVHVAQHRESKGELRPKRLMPTVFSLYERYMTRLYEAGGPNQHPFSSSERKVLSENADCLTLQLFQALRREILTSTPMNKCAYCYQIRAYEVDHYLPRSKFGEYAIYAPNLVPICTICNGKKSNRYKRDDGQGRRYVHPYADKMPDGSTVYLSAEVHVGKSVVVSYKLMQPNEIDDDLWAVVSSQFDDLKLLARYETEAAEDMAGMLPVYYAHFQRDGAEELRHQLLLIKFGKENLYGPNHWWTVLYSALSESAEFCQGGFKALGPNRSPIA